jgi:hypothetical protein
LVCLVDLLGNVGIVKIVYIVKVEGFQSKSRNCSSVRPAL